MACSRRACRSVISFSCRARPLRYERCHMNANERNTANSTMSSVVSACLTDDIPLIIWARSACATIPQGAFRRGRVTDQVASPDASGSSTREATPVAANRFLAEQIPGAELRVLKEVSHCYQLEKPLEFNQVLEEFVAKHGH